MESSNKHIKEYSKEVLSKNTRDERGMSIHLVKKAIASSARNTIESLDIRLVICLTETGSTANYLTGYHFKCPILVLCSDYRVARSLQGYKSVFTLCLGSLVGFESVLERY